MFMIEYRDVAWWYWLVTAILLTVGMFADTNGYYLAIALTVVHTIHYLLRERVATAFPVQVRIAYLGLLLISLPEQLQIIFWIPLVGTWAQVIFGYCAMARFLSLFSWNRREPFTVPWRDFYPCFHGTVGNHLLSVFWSKPSSPVPFAAVYYRGLQKMHKPLRLQ